MAAETSTHPENVMLERLIGMSVHSIEKIGMGGNSRVYRIGADDGTYAAKFYFQRTVDGLDRLDVEFAAMCFLWENGIRCIPQPLFADRSGQIAIYEFIEGGDVGLGSVSAPDIDQLTGFLAALKQLSAHKDAASQPNASEAVFTIADIISNIHKRLESLSAVEGTGDSHIALRRFLSQQFAPALEKASEAALCRSQDNEGGEPLSITRRTLSPSDYGFHNALRRKDGSLAFVDFEYFGWDDPAKMIADFCWHPRNEQLSAALKHRFSGNMLSALDADGALAERLDTVYPLFGLKWCMILLNEFRPEFLARRRFASATNSDSGKVQMIQLCKAERTLARINENFGNFPYRQA